ncbi:unnamed protein product [Larinioides sclopetarius]|uniref:Uncharacterized protein n=1 Tax=Larinioides sclopetarius TaxID=280406 RepID=A0AAV1YUE8_9ARAC
MPMCGVQSKSSTYGVPQSICCYRDGNVLNIRILNVWMKKHGEFHWFCWRLEFLTKTIEHFNCCNLRFFLVL